MTVRDDKRRALTSPLLISVVLHVLLVLVLSSIRVVPMDSASSDVFYSVAAVETVQPRPKVRATHSAIRPDRASYERSRVVGPLTSRELSESGMLTPPMPSVDRHVEMVSLAVSPLSIPTRAFDLASPSAGGGSRLSELSDLARSAKPVAAWLPPRPASGVRDSLDGRADAESPFGDSGTLLNRSPLEVIADSLGVRPRGVATNKADVVFLVDASQSMQDNIYIVSRHLSRMAQRLSVSGLDFRIGVVTFRNTTLGSVLGSNMEVTPLTADTSTIERALEKVKCKGGEKALNALMDAIPLIRYRDDASRHLVLVTDEYVDGEHASLEVFGALYRARIQVDVIGMDEPFQRALASRTGGTWTPIANLSS
ncbi:VWA domain-containing protein [Candidatus Poribacteria bacterium]|nr:VWA domain-containing protein [Candidatus Poribacteria bacterium]